MERGMEGWRENERARESARARESENESERGHARRVGDGEMSFKYPLPPLFMVFLHPFTARSNPEPSTLCREVEAEFRKMWLEYIDSVQ